MLISLSTLSSWITFFFLSLKLKIISSSLNLFDSERWNFLFHLYLALPFFGIGKKTDLFQSCGHCWVFQICWQTECSTFTASPFRIWNSSTGIPLPPLALFLVMLPKAHLTSHSRMSGFRWVITQSWFSGLWRSFLYRSSVFLFYLILLFFSISLHWSLRKTFLSLLAILWNSAFKWV